MSDGGLEVLRLVIEFLAVPLALILWWMLRRLTDDVASHKGELAAYKLHVAENFSTKNDLSKAIDQFSKAVEAVFAKLERIEDKLDDKADKARV